MSRMHSGRFRHSPSVDPGGSPVAKCWNSNLPVLFNSPGETIRCWVCKARVRVTPNSRVAAHDRTR